MTSKIHLNKLIQISNNEEAALANINANVDILNDVIDDYVSRSAKVPTQMQAPLDMGSQKIINVGTPTDDNDVVRYKDVKDALATIEQVQIDIQDVDNAVIRANNAASFARNSAVEAVLAKDAAVSAKMDAQAADEHITELLTEDYPEITTVANNISDVSTVAGNISDVNAVADVSSDVSTVAGMSSDIADVVANMTDIQNASQNAQDAAASATAAQQWATKMDGPVLGSDYSSEYYAAQAAASATEAANIVASIGTVMRYKGSVATYADLPSTGNTVGDVYNVTDTGINYAWTTENTWDDFGGAVTVSLAACTDVDLSSPTNGQVLSYNATTQKWENANASGGNVDQTYDATSANAQSGVAINGAGFLQNTGNSSYSNLGIIGTTNASSGRNRQVAIGYGATTHNSDSVAIGYNANSGSNTKAVAIGSGASSASSGIAIGYSSSVTNSGGIAMNGKTSNGIAIGTGNTSTSTGAQAVAIGGNATGTYAVTLGKSTTATATNSISLGYYANTSAAYAIQLGYGTNNTANTLSVGLSTSNNYELLSSDGTIPFARQAKSIIEGASDPDTATVGTVGLLYRNTTDGGIFKCTDITGGVYTWEELSAGGGGSVDLDDIAVAGSGVTLQRPAIGFDVVGSPTISSAGVASGFSDSNYLECQNIINSASQSFEFVTAIELNTTSSIDGCAIIDTSSSQNIRLTLTSDAKIRLRVTADGTSPYPVDITSTTALTTNTKYWIKITYSSTEGYDLYTSTNGTSWTQEAHSVELTRPYYGGGLIKFGDNNATGYSLDGSIYLADTSINVNGSILWEAYNPDKTSISAAASVVDQTYDASSTNAVSGVAIANSRILQNSSTASHALTLLGTATTQANSVNIGYSSQASSGGYSVAVGSSAITRGNGVSVGKEAQQSSGCSFGVALGSESKVGAFVCGTSLGAKASVQAHGSIQIGQGTNSEAQTLYVGFSDSSGTATNNYKMLDSSGHIPAARLTNAVQGALTSSSVTLAAADWSGNAQTVTVNGITSSSFIWVSPAAASASDYADAGILCTAQATNSLTFTCDTTPSTDITVTIVFG